MATQIVRVRGPQDATVELVSTHEELAAWTQREETSGRPELWLRHVKQFYSVVTRAAPTSVGSDATAALDMSAKVVKLASLLAEVVFSQCMVFCNDKLRAEALATALAAQGWPAVCITGSQSQAARSEAMAGFRAFRSRVLVSTDLTARGIDVDRVNFVVNLDLPRDPATYLHRVGRAGRFGGRGLAVTLLASEDVGAVEMLARVFQMSIEELPTPVPRTVLEFVRHETNGKRSEDVGPAASEALPLSEEEEEAGAAEELVLIPVRAVESNEVLGSEAMGDDDAVTLQRFERLKSKPVEFVTTRVELTEKASPRSVAVGASRPVLQPMSTFALEEVCYERWLVLL